MFTRLDIDDEAYEEAWVKGCADSGIEATPITLEEAFKLEPRLSRKHVKSAYLVPDAAVDGFRMSWQLIDSAKRYGGAVKTYTEVIGFESVNGELRGVKVRDQFTGEEYKIACGRAAGRALSASWRASKSAFSPTRVRSLPSISAL